MPYLNRLLVLLALCPSSPTINGFQRCLDYKRLTNSKFCHWQVCCCCCCCRCSSFATRHLGEGLCLGLERFGEVAVTGRTLLLLAAQPVE